MPLTLVESDDSEELGEGAMKRPETTGGAVPRVTIAMVAHNPGAWFDEALTSIRTQDYPAIDVVVIDPASDIAVAPRVHKVLPEATIVPLVTNQGFAKTANTMLEHSSGRYLLICHDDVALAPDCVRRLVEEAVRSNAGVVGPKLLDWNDPNRILHVGFTADKTGAVSDIAEPGEFDQEQHDAVRDVFAVPGAVTLLRSDLFTALGGFDEAMIAHGEDLDLCWRAHALGARVLINPAATARHREDLSSRVVGHQRDRFAQRHRIRSLLSNYGLWHTLRVVPQALAVTFVSAIIALLQGRIGDIATMFGAWLWNLKSVGSIFKRRRQLSKTRQIDDGEVRALQQPGFEGVSAWRRSRADRRESIATTGSVVAAVSAARERRRWIQVSVLVWIGVAAVLLFGSRGLIFDSLPIVNEFAGFPDSPRPLLTEWGTTWRSTGLGSEAPSSPLHFLLGFAGIALFGQMGLLRLLVTVGLVLVGTIGMYRCLAPFRSPQAQLVGLVLYAAAPVPYNSFYAGSWSGLAVYAAMPWIARRLATAASLAPFGDEEQRLTRRFGDVALLGLVLAITALIEPLVAVALAILVVGWVLGALATSWPSGLGRLLASALMGVVIAALLSLPGSLALVRGDLAWSSIAGVSGGEDPTLFELMRLATGPHGRGAFGWALAVLPALALVLAFGHRLIWAARSWFAAVLAVAAAWAATSNGFDLALGDPEVLLAPAAFSLAFAGAMGALAFTNDLRRHRFGWRQFVPFVALGALTLTTLGGLAGSVDGRWQMPTAGYESVFGFFDDKAPAHSRILWLGDRDVLPVDGWDFDGSLSWSITQARRPTVVDLPFGNPDPAAREVRETVADTLAGASSRLGQRLAPAGIRYVVVVEANAPRPFGTVERPVDDAVLRRLSEQLDLVRVEVRGGATILENRAYVPMVASFPADILLSEPPPTLRQLLGVPFTLALPEVRSLRDYSGSLDQDGVWLAVNDPSNWQVSSGGEVLSPSPVLGPGVGYRAPLGSARLEHRNDSRLMIAAIVQLGVWAVVVTVLVLGRRRNP